MVKGKPRTEEEREERHEALYGEKAPAERRGLGAQGTSWVYVVVAFLLGLVTGLLL